MNRRHVNKRRLGSTSTAVVLAVASVVLTTITTSRPSLALVTVPKNVGVRHSASPFHHGRGHQWARLPAEQSLSTWHPKSSSNLFGSKSTIRDNHQRSRLICHYANEWMDADVELSFHNSSNESKKSANKRRPRWMSSSRSSSLLLRILAHLSQRWYHLKETFRTRLERCTVYVLQCEGNKYYVGSTTNRKRRIAEHLKRRGAKWTRQYKPLKVLKEYRRIPSKYILGMESRITAEAMLEYGVNNVRGSMFCSPRQYHMGDIDALTKFLGHYNDLNYRKVHLRLSQTLPSNPAKAARMRKKTANYNSYMAGRCYNCGKAGHFAADCPEKKKEEGGGGGVAAAVVETTKREGGGGGVVAVSLVKNVTDSTTLRP